MKVRSTITATIIAILMLNCSSEKEQLLEIYGTVVGVETKSILLKKLHQDMRHDSIIEIPVVDGRFHYQAKLQHPEAVLLILGEARERNMYRPMNLFLENSRLDLTIHAEEEFDKNIISGGELNGEYLRYKQSVEDTFDNEIGPLQDSIGRLWDDRDYFSDEAKLWQDKLDGANQKEKVEIYKALNELEERGLMASPKRQALEAKLKPIEDEMYEFRHEYILTHPTIVSYSFVLEDLLYQEEVVDLDKTKQAISILSKANPDHPYNAFARRLYNAIDNIQVGKQYVDFIAPDLSGSPITLSDQINGKMTLLNLWATWCGPCISKTRSMMPVYEAYKDKGFTIFGVAGEFKSTAKLERFLAKEQWPWQNVVELDRQNTIWQTYGVDGSGGGIFLIDEQGLIVAIDPTPEEVQKHIASRLN